MDRGWIGLFSNLHQGPPSSPPKLHRRPGTAGRVVLSSHQGVVDLCLSCLKAHQQGHLQDRAPKTRAIGPWNFRMLPGLLSIAGCIIRALVRSYHDLPVLETRPPWTGTQYQAVRAIQTPFRFGRPGVGVPQSIGTSDLNLINKIHSTRSLLLTLSVWQHCLVPPQESFHLRLLSSAIMTSVHWQHCRPSRLSAPPPRFRSGRHISTAPSTDCCILGVTPDASG